MLGTFLPEQGYHPLLSGSPAIDAGNPATCLTTDQRGLARVGTCDIGAYEFTAAGVITNISMVSGNDQHTAPNTAFSKPLKIVALDSQGSPIPNVNVTFTTPASGVSGTFNDTGTNTTSPLTDAGGIATTSTLTTNGQLGIYNVTASSNGVTPVNFNLQNSGLYVATTGNDANSCTVAASPCATIIVSQSTVQ